MGTRLPVAAVQKLQKASLERDLTEKMAAERVK